MENVKFKENMKIPPKNVNRGKPKNPDKLKNHGKHENPGKL